MVAGDERCPWKWRTGCRRASSQAEDDEPTRTKRRGLFSRSRKEGKVARSEVAPETNAARGSSGRGVVGPASRPRKTSRSEPNAESFSAARERSERRRGSRRAQRPSAWLFSRNEGQRGVAKDGGLRACRRRRAEAKNKSRNCPLLWRVCDDSRTSSRGRNQTYSGNSHNLRSRF